MNKLYRHILKHYKNDKKKHNKMYKTLTFYIKNKTQFKTEYLKMKTNFKYLSNTKITLVEITQSYILKKKKCQFAKRQVIT